MLLRSTALNLPELMPAIVRDPLTVSPNITVMAAISQMSGMRTLCTTTKTVDGQLAELHRSVRASCVVLVEARKVVGILTERDVVRLSAQQQDLDRLTMRQVMVHPVITCRESAFTDLFSTMNLLQQHKIRHLPILDEQDQLVGIVTHESLWQISHPIDLLQLRLVEEVMTREVICADPESSMLTIAQLMANHRVSSVVIAEPAGRATDSSQPGSQQIPVGIITERDLVQFQALGLNLRTCTAAAVMSSPIFAVTPGESLWTVQQILEQRFIRRLAVTGKQGELLGIITQTNLLQALNPLELYKLAGGLEARVKHLEAEKVALLESRTVELEHQVEARTAALKAKANQERLLTDLTTQIRSSLSLQTILATTVVQVRQVLGCDRVSIWQYTSAGEAIVVAESTDLPMSWLGEHMRDPSVQPTQVDRYRQGQIQVVDDIYTTEMADCHRDFLIHLQTRATILVPLLHGHELWGFLNACESQHTRRWKLEEVELLQALAAQLAIALQQATTHQQLQEELKERRQAELRLELQNSILERIAKTEPLSVILDALLRSIELQVVDAHCSVMLCDLNGLLHCELAPRLPEAYLQAIDGIALDEEPDSDRRSGFHRDLVISSDIATDPLWRDHRDLALEHGLKACWSVPILASDGKKILGILAVYYPSRRTPQPLEIKSLTQAANLAGIAIERDVAAQALAQLNQDLERRVEDRTAALQASETLFRHAFDNTAVGMCLVSLEGYYLKANAALCQFLGYSEAELLEKQLHDIIHPEDVAITLALVQQVLVGEIQSYQTEKRYVTKQGQVVWGFSSASLVRDSNDQPLYFVTQIQDISDRKQAEAALAQYTYEVEDLYNNAPCGYHSLDPNGRLIRVNNTELRWLGYSREEMIGQPLIRFFTEASRQAFLKHYPLFLAQGWVQNWEYDMVRQDGTILPVMMSATAVKDAEDNHLYSRATLVDVHDLKQMEAELTESEAKFRRLVEGGEDLIWSTNDTGLFTYLSPQFMTLFGWEPSEWLGKSFLDLVHPDDRQWVMVDSANVQAGYTSANPEFRHRHRNGHYVWVQVSATPVRSATGGMVGAQGVLSDISDRKQAELALQASEIRFRRVFDSSAVGMVFADFQGSITDANDCFLQMVGYTREELEAGAMRWTQMTPPEYAAVDQEAMQRLTQYGFVSPFEKEYYRKNGSRVPILIGSALLPGTMDQTICVIVDVSERAQLEAERQQYQAQLHQTNEELARATRLKDEFLANMSHELRTPLNAILGMAEGLQEGVFGEVAPKQLKALQTIEHSGTHLLELINDILDVAKIESGQVELNCLPTDVGSLCQSSLAFVKQQALRKRIQLEIKLPSNLPKLWGDERRIRQVLINLLSNAVKFTPEGGHITVEVSRQEQATGFAPPPLQGITRVRVFRTALEEKMGLGPQVFPPFQDTSGVLKGFLRIAVRDTGIGIAPEHIDKLFRPFIQIDSALDRQYEGTGLGLALVKRIVELHGGKVGLVSEVGVGSCFTIDLPFVVDPAYVAEPEVSLEPEQLAVRTASLILLVEDNNANIMTIAGYLEAKGYRVLMATNGQEAIAMVQSEHPDLILMDIQMPGMDGLAAIRQIRGDSRFVDVPIVALTALAMEGDRERCLAAGASEYLSKPIKLKQLAATVQHLLDAATSI